MVDGLRVRHPFPVFWWARRETALLPTLRPKPKSRRAWLSEKRCQRVSRKVVKSRVPLVGWAKVRSAEPTTTASHYTHHVRLSARENRGGTSFSRLHSRIVERSAGTGNRSPPPCLRQGAAALAVPDTGDLHSSRSYACIVVAAARRFRFRATMESHQERAFRAHCLRPHAH